MKALSIRQPWAWAILHGKDIENRKWKTTYTGSFLIHAAKTFDKEGYRWLCKNSHLLKANIPHSSFFQTGGIVGRAKIVECLDRCNSPWFSGPYGFVISEAQPVSFTPCKGSLNFFEVPYLEQEYIERESRIRPIGLLSNHYAIIVEGKIIDCLEQGSFLEKQKKRLSNFDGIEIRRTSMSELQEFNLRRAGLAANQS